MLTAIFYCYRKFYGWFLFIILEHLGNNVLKYFIKYQPRAYYFEKCALYVILIVEIL